MSIAAMNTIFVLSTIVAIATGATTPALQATSVPLGNEVMFACRSDTPAVWVKQSPDLAQVVFLSHNGHPIDSSVDLDRFAFSKVGADQYVLVVKSVQFSDAGFYKCSNVMTAALTVIAPPSCSPSLPTTAMMENREVLAACEVEFAGPAPGPRLDWHIANVTHQGPTGAPKTSTTSVYSNRTFVVTGQEHGSSLFCSIFHEHWNHSIPKPNCVISKFLNVTYKPQLVCPDKLVFHESDSAYKVECDAFMNPVVHPNDIHWLLSNGNYTHSLQNETKYFNFHLHRVARGYQITAILHKTMLSRDTPTRKLTLHVFGPTRGMPTSTEIILELHHGPTLHCPDRQSLAAPSVVTVTCNLFAYPSIPWENVTWRLGERYYDLRHQMSSGFPNMRSIPGGVALALVADRDISEDERLLEGKRRMFGLDSEMLDDKRASSSSPPSTSTSSHLENYGKDNQKISSSPSKTKEQPNPDHRENDHNDDEDEPPSFRSYRETYHVTLQVHATSGTVEKNITVSDPQHLRRAESGGDSGVEGVLIGRGVKGDVGVAGFEFGAGEKIKKGLQKSEEFFGVVEASIITCFFLMLALITLLIFGLWHRHSEEAALTEDSGSKEPPTCCAWRRVSQYDENEDADLREYASRISAHRGFSFIGGGIEGVNPTLTGVTLGGVPMTTPNDYGITGGVSAGDSSSRCDSHCENSPASCAALNYSITHYGSGHHHTHLPTSIGPPPLSSCLDHLDAEGVAQHF